MGRTRSSISTAGFSFRGASGTSHRHVAIFSSVSATRRKGPSRKPAPAPRLLTWRPRGESLGLSRPPFPCLCPALNELVYTQRPEWCLAEGQPQSQDFLVLALGQKPDVPSWLRSCAQVGAGLQAQTGHAVKPRDSGHTASQGRFSLPSFGQFSLGLKLYMV